MASPSKIANGKPEQAAQADAEQPQTETTSDQKKSNSNVPNSTNNSNNSGSSDCPNPKSANDEKTHRLSPQSQPQQQQQQPQQQQQQQPQQQQQQQQQPQAPTVFRIPSYCSWFSMDRFHSTEQRLLPEFFDGRSPSKTPRVYKDLRDFIINKYRENPQRKINFTEVRKMLVGDVNSVRRVYDFLENWGLVNYQATAKKHGRVDEETEAGNKNSGSAERAAAADAKKDFPRKVLCNLCGVNCATVRFDSLKGLPEGVNTKSGDESGSKDPGISSLTNDSNVDGQQEMDNETSKLGTKLQKVQKNDEKGKEEIEQNEVKEKLSKQSEKLLRCPRCDSLGTKFCYYNNYDLNQPRHFCKNCQRYWTVGGTMRNVPIGAGRRKGKQATPYYWYAMKPVSAIVAKGDGSDPPCPQVGFVLCAACYAHGNFGPGLSASDYKRVEMKDTSQHKGIEWSDQELLLLLEGLLRHGDDWKSVAQYVGTKSEVDCVTKFLQLPLGEQYLNDDISDRISSSFTGESAVPSQSFRDSLTLEHEQGSCDDKHCPPDDMNLHLIQRCLTPFADADNPTIAQVSFLSAIAGPNVVEAAARAAVDAVGQEPTEFLNLFAEEEDISKPEKDASASEQCIEKGKVDGDKQESCETMMIDAKNEGADIIAEINGDINQCTDHEKERTFMHKKKVAIAKDIRSAALLAKSEIDEEYRNVELTYSSIIENEVKLLHEKVEHFDRMDKISEREKSQLEQIKQFVVAERIRLSQEAAKSSQIARRDSKGTHSGILQ